MSILGRFLPGFDRSFFLEELRFTDLLRPKSVAGKAVINFTDKKKLKDRVLDSPYVLDVTVFSVIDCAGD
jgi:hypothetical protein